MASRKTDSTVDSTATSQAETVPEALDLDRGGWRPEPGDVLTGKVADLTTGGDGSEFGRYPIVVIERKDGTEVAVHAFHHTLRNRLREMRPKVGHTLTITYHGEEPQYDKDGNPRVKNGREMTLNRYTVDSPEFEFNWDAF